jgi:hypothetical protein
VSSVAATVSLTAIGRPLTVMLMSKSRERGEVASASGRVWMWIRAKCDPTGSVAVFSV